MRTIRVLSLLLLTVLCVTACHQGKPLYGNLRAEADSLPAAPDVRPYALNSNFRITADTLWLHELPFTDSLAVYRGDELVVAECAVHPEDSIDSLWVKVARDQATMGWIQEHKLLENIVPVDPISQGIHWFSSRRTLAFFIVLGVFFLWTVARAIRRKQLRLVWANDIDSLFPVILSWLLVFAATLYNTLQSFMPQIWQRYYYAPSLNPFEQPFVLGLPTGSSPLGMYKALIELNKKGIVSFRNVVTFNMDEYVGLPESHPESYHSFMFNNFFNHIDIRKENIHILNGNAADLHAECENYEKEIEKFGGIDLFLGGIGPDGHIAFNEPGSSLASRTRVKTLTTDTIIANSRFFDNDVNKVPKTALTVGVATVLAAREVLIICNGHNKARALQHAIEGGITQMWTISALQMHRHGIIVCDEAATDELKVSTYKYFKDIEKNNL